MKILFSGASSFSGLWFIKELVSRGHTVTAVFKRSLEEYQGIRQKRVSQLLPICTPIFKVAFGDERFLDLCLQRWDMYCHHAADVTDYRSPAFNVSSALASNTKNLKEVLQVLQKNDCQKILLTGSVFEQNEGQGSDGLRAVSPYGLSKGLTTDVFAFYTTILQMKLAKFVIPNPFGSYEEGRFTNYLSKTWLEGKVAAVNTPLYIRDNVPVSLLAKAYVYFAENLIGEPIFEKFNPSCFAESQGDFTKRFAEAMRPRFGKECLFELKQQQDFAEPIERINFDPLDFDELQWQESAFWDESARYYQSLSLEQ